jgi:hypothetical protein
MSRTSGPLSQSTPPQVAWPRMCLIFWMPCTAIPASICMPVAFAWMRTMLGIRPMWRLVHQSIRCMYWNCPINGFAAVLPVSELWRRTIPCDWTRLGGTTTIATVMSARKPPCPHAQPPARRQASSLPIPGTDSRLPTAETDVRLLMT